MLLSVVSQIDFTKIGLDVTDVYIFAGILLAAIGAIWGIKKMILMGNGRIGFVSTGDKTEDDVSHSRIGFLSNSSEESEMSGEADNSMNEGGSWSFWDPKTRTFDLSRFRDEQEDEEDK